MPLILLLLSILGAAATSGGTPRDARKWSWMGGVYAPCEGVGVLGAFRVHVQADVRPDGDSVAVRNLQGRASSASFIGATKTFSIEVAVVTSGDVERQRTVLRRPDGPALEPAPAEDESRALYVPASTVLRLARDERLRFTATASLRTDAGWCSLGTTRHTLDPRSEQP